MERVRKQIGCENFNTKEKGHGVTIAVLDTGIAMHPDFSGRILAFKDFVSGKNSIYDDSGHGTHVCGIACGSGFASGGRYRGIAPEANLVVGKVLNNKGDGSVENMLTGLDWIQKNQKIWNIRILNISVGLGGRVDEKKEKNLRNKLEEIWADGILVVCAAGNNGPACGSISHVGESPYLITVGCHDGNFLKYQGNLCETYSARGKKDALYRKPDIVAPGTRIISCNSFFKRRGRQIQNAYIEKSGTSMSTPMVSASLALLLCKYPGLSKEQAKYQLLHAADPLNEPPEKQGYGMLNVKRVLTDLV